MSELNYKDRSFMLDVMTKLVERGWGKHYGNYKKRPIRIVKSKLKSNE